MLYRNFIWVVYMLYRNFIWVKKFYLGNVYTALSKVCGIHTIERQKQEI